MLKVIRQNTVINDYDDLRIFKVVGYYSNPKHAYDTLEECIEYLKATNNWI